jgi:hypothetical protein
LFWIRALEIVASNALGIGAASFCSEAEKDIAESPTTERSGAGTPKIAMFKRIKNILNNY